MLRDALFLARKELAHYYRRPQVWVWSFVMPVLLAYLVGSLMPFAAQPRRDPLALYAGEDAGFLLDELTRRLDASGYDVRRIADAEKFARYPLRLSVPARFTTAVLAGPPVEVELTYDRQWLRSEFDIYRVRRAVLGVLTDLVVLSKHDRGPTPAGFAALAAEPRKVKLRVTSAGTPRRPVLGFQQSVPGFIVMFALLITLNSGGIMLVVERRRGILRRLASAPVSRGAVVAGKMAARAGLGLVQVGFAMLAGSWLFGVYWGGPALWMVLLLLAAWVALCAALSLVAGMLARSEAQSLAIGNIATCVLAALGGCWWPIEITPKWMQRASLLLPTGWAMDGLHKLLSYGASPAAVAPHVAALGVAAVAVGWVAARRFRFE